VKTEKRSASPFVDKFYRKTAKMNLPIKKNAPPSYFAMHFQQTFFKALATQQFNKLVTDVVDHQPPFNTLPLFHQFAAMVRSYAPFKHRHLVHQKIVDQYAMDELELPPFLDKLKYANCYTICTGHQLNLFSGPAYFFQKIISIVQLTKHYQRTFTDCHFIPVFWMASEDHDIAEINHAQLFGKKYQWNTEQTGAAGRLTTAGIAAILDEMAPELLQHPHGMEVLEIFHKAYALPTLSQATRFLVHYFFNRYNVAILDADDAQLKKQFAAIMKDELLNQSTEPIIHQAIDRLTELHYPIQAKPRPINLFHLSPNMRQRIVRTNDQWQLSSNTVNETELIAALEQHPEDFSPNVLLRPLYQQTILPNVAYVGGPGEIAYWAELPSLFAHHKVTFPLLALRSHVIMMDEKQTEKWIALGLSPADLFEQEQVIATRLAEANTGVMPDFSEIEQKSQELYLALEAMANTVDPTLMATVAGERQKQMQGIKNIQDKMAKAKKRKADVFIQQYKKIKEQLMPEGVLAERSVNFLQYYAQYGPAYLQYLTNQLEGYSEGVFVLQQYKSTISSSDWTSTAQQPQVK
jgi:bacillithiol biosynthesis cysteine-adding enzyme BshC